MSEEKKSNDDLAPIIGPLLGLLRSRKFLVAVVTLGIDVVVAFVPELEPVRGELLTVLTVVGSVLIGAIAHEDAAEKRSGVKG